MSENRPYAGAGDDGESEAVHAPHRDDDPPTGSRAQPTAWLFAIGLLILLVLGFLIAWGIGMLDSGGS